MSESGDRWSRVEELLAEVESALEVGLEEIYPEEWGGLNTSEIGYEISEQIIGYVPGAQADYDAWNEEN